MNYGLYLHLQEIDADLARDYDRACRTADGGVRGREQVKEMIDDVDRLVDRLLGRLSKAEAEAEELRSEIHALEGQAVKDSEE